MGDLRSPPLPVNVGYLERLAKRDFLKNLQTAYLSQRIALRHARTKSHFVRYFGWTARNIHVIEQIARTLLPSEVVDLTETQLARRIETSMIAVDKATARVQALLHAEAITALPEYIQRPLEVEAKCTSPKVSRYVELILKSDRLMTYLEALRLSGAITTGTYDHQVAVAIRNLVAVPRSAFHLAIALRKRAAEVPAPQAKGTQASRSLDAKGKASEPPSPPEANTVATEVNAAEAAQSA